MIVAGIGQCSWDLLAVVDSYPEVDTKKEILEWHEQGGGPVATALVALTRLGVRCRFAGVTGDDEAGEKIRRSLASEGLDTRFLVSRAGSSSQVAFIAIERDGARRTIFWRRPSGLPLAPSELRDDLFSGCAFLLLDGLMAEASLHAARRARALNIPVMLDAGRLRPDMRELAVLSDYVVASEEFAKDLSWELTAGFLREKRKEIGTKVLTVTLGNLGSITVSSAEAFQQPAFQVDAVDTTGAGDVFHGGYLYGLLQGWDLRRTVVFASALAAMKCTKIGGRTGIPGLGEVLGFLAARGADPCNADS